METTQHLDLSAGMVPKIDLSSGMVPRNPASAPAIDLSAGIVPITMTTIPPDHVAMTDTSGQLQAVHKSNAGAMLKQGWKVGPPQQQPKYDLATDPAITRYVGDTSLPTQDDMSGTPDVGGNSENGPSMGQTAKQFGKEFLTGLRKMAFYKPSAGESAAHYEPLEGTAGAMVKSGQQAVGQAKQGQYGRAAVSGLSAVDPFAAGPVSEINDLEQQGRGTEAAQRGLINAALLASSLPKVQSAITDAASATSRIPGATRAAFTRTAAQTLGSVIKPEPSTLGAFQVAAERAMPQVNAAMQARGVGDITLDSVIDSVSQAKDDLLRQYQASLGRDQHLGELHPQQADQLNRDMAALNDFQDGLEAKRQQLSAMPKGDSIAAVDKLNTGIGKAFRKLTEPPSLSAILGIPDADAAPQPIGGDLSVEHTTQLAPPETPHGDAAIIPVRSGRIPLADQAGIKGGRPPVIEPEPMTAAPLHQPAPEVRQRALLDIIRGAPIPDLGGLGQVETGVPTSSTLGMTIAPPEPQPAGARVPRGQHPEDIITENMMRNPLPRVRAAAKELGISVTAEDNHQTLIPKILDKILELDAQPGTEGLLNSMAEHTGGLRGEILPSSEPASANDADYSDIMQRSVEAANARKGTQPRTLQDIVRGPEQRQNLDYRSQVDAMKPLDRERAIYQNELTGLPNRRAFDDFGKAGLAQTHPHIGYADIDDFKKVNTALGHEGADAVLQEIGTLMAEAQADENGAVHAFHRSGDEFIFRASDPEAIRRVVDKVNNQLAKTKFTFSDSAGREVEQKGIGLSNGTGSTLESAEANANANKQFRKQQGIRTTTGASTVRSLGEPSSNGITAEVNNLPERQSVQASEPHAVSEDAFSKALRRQGEEQNAFAGMSSASSPQAGTSPDNPISPHELQPGQAAYVKVNELIPQPQKYQYKGNTDTAGVVAGQITGTKYNHDLANALSYHIDEGVASPVNGHNRRNLAVRSGEQGVLARRIDAPDVATARKIGALQNVSEGRGTALDAANFFREEKITPDDLRKRGIAITEGVAQQGLALAKLDPILFEKVRSGQWTESRGATIGAVTDNPSEQEAIAKLIQKAENRGKDLNNGQVESLARQVANAGKRIEQGQDLFGAFTREHSTAIERAELDDHIQRQIAGDRRTFGAVASQSKANALGQVQGQSIKASENAKISQRAAQELELYRKLSDKAGDVNTILENGAKELANGNDKPAAIKAKTAARVREVIRQYLPPDTEGNHPAGSKGASGSGKSPEAKTTSRLIVEDESDPYRAALLRRKTENDPFAS